LGKDCCLAVAQHGLEQWGKIWMWRKPLEHGDVDRWCSWILTDV
jgi:hypothetical protein